MNNARMWLVVNPTVGIPVFLGAVAVGSFSVHVGIVTNTTWVEDFLSGREMGSTAALSAPSETAVASVDGAKIVFEDDAVEGQRAVVILDDGRTAQVVFEEPAVQTASLSAALD